MTLVITEFFSRAMIYPDVFFYKMTVDIKVIKSTLLKMIFARV